MANIMTKRGSLDNVVTYEHFCDTAADLANIPSNEITLGSVAVVLKDSNDELCIYLANSAKEWIPFSAGGSGGNTSLSDLLDISLTNPTDGQTLVYNSVTEKWENNNGIITPVYTITSTGNDTYTTTCDMSYQEVLAAVKAKKCLNCYVIDTRRQPRVYSSLNLIQYIDESGYIGNDVGFSCLDTFIRANEVEFNRRSLMHLSNLINYWTDNITLTTNS